MSELWIARDADGELYAYPCKPVRVFKTYIVPKGKGIRLKKEMWPEITYLSGPVKFEPKCSDCGS